MVGLGLYNYVQEVCIDYLVCGFVLRVFFFVCTYYLRAILFVSDGYFSAT